MNKGLIAVLVFLAFPLAVLANGEIYKIVNPDGSITGNIKAQEGVPPRATTDSSAHATDVVTSTCTSKYISARRHKPSRGEVLVGA